MTIKSWEGRVSADLVFNFTEFKNKNASKGDLKAYPAPDFIRLFDSPVLLSCTMAEYASKDKNERDRLKGGKAILGGVMEDGGRKKSSIASRTIVSIDYDDLSPDIDLPCLIQSAFPDTFCVIHPTASWRPEAPRYRVHIPLAGNICKEKYEPLCRLIADRIGIRTVDISGFSPSQLMYLPRVPKDMPYDDHFSVLNSRPLDGEALLDTLGHPLDRSLWPVFDKDRPFHVSNGTVTVEDPRKKDGNIGTFCRTYDIPGAIGHFLSDTFVSTDDDDRYTYSKGSTTGGAVLYPHNDDRNGSYVFL